MIDTHCHLDAAAFDADRDRVVALANAGGVKHIVIPAVTVDNFAAVKTSGQRYPHTLPCYGIHPLYVAQATANDVTTLRQWLVSECPGAVGEIGLDFYEPGFDAGRQAWFFSEQLRLAREFDLPVLLHVRRAVDEVLKHLRRLPVRGGIAHAFNGSRQQAEIFIGLGFKLGFGGAMTYSGSTRIRQLAATLPLESIVLETDSPDMPPAWLNRGRNSPAELPRIAATLAELRGISLSEVIAVTSTAARQAIPALRDDLTPPTPSAFSAAP